MTAARTLTALAADDQLPQFTLADLRRREAQWLEQLREARSEAERWRSLAKHWKTISLIGNPDHTVVEVKLAFNDSLDSRSMKLGPDHRYDAPPSRPSYAAH